MRWETNFALRNTFDMAARARLYAEYASVEELRACLPRLAGERVLHIGEGSNLLFTRDWDGVALHSGILGYEVIGEEGDSVLVRAGAGETWDDLVVWAIERGMSGVENLSLIPGQTGAAAVQNIGAYGVELADVVECVEAVDLRSGDVRQFPRIECDYGYRRSAFKGTLRGQYAVTHVQLRLSKVFRPRLAYGGLAERLSGKVCTVATVRDAVVDLRRGKLPDPRVLGNAGSFFMNPVISEETFARLRAQYPQAPHYRQEDGVKVPAGWLIEQCGWKGKALGRAAVHDKQALVLVNLGGATGDEVVRLAQRIAADVKGRFGIDIRPEVNIL